MIFLPFLFAITEVTSLGSALLPLMWGWAVAAQAAVGNADKTGDTSVSISADEPDAIRG